MKNLGFDYLCPNCDQIMIHNKKILSFDCIQCDLYFDYDAENNYSGKGELIDGKTNSWGTYIVCGDFETCRKQFKQIKIFL